MSGDTGDGADGAGQVRGAGLRIEPVVSRPRRAETGRAYLVEVDLRGPADPDAWPYEQEEFAFGIALDGSPHFVCEVLGHPGVVLHRFGGTYGPARFVVTAGDRTGTATLRLSVSNSWGVPVRTTGLTVEVVAADAGTGADPAAPAEDGVPVRLPPQPAGAAAPPSGPEPDTRPEPVPPRRTRTRPAARTSPPPSVPADPGAGLRPGAAPSLPALPAPPAQRGPDRAPQPIPPLDPRVITVSYAGRDLAWASWIAERLSRHEGLRVTLRRWDPGPDGRLRDSLHDLLLTGGRVLMVLTQAYLGQAGHTVEEWADALHEVADPSAERFAAVSATAVDLGPLPRFPSAADLWDVGTQEAERRLLAALGLPEPRSARPGKPAAALIRYPMDAPAVWGGVPRRNPRFTGREAVLARLRTTLSEAGPGRSGRCALVGMSGVGKTQIAAEYVYRHAAEYDVVWWVQSDQRGMLRERMAALAPALGLVTGREYGQRLRAVREALREGAPYRRWLLVLDGADDLDDALELLPQGAGHALVTSRNRAWGEHVGMADVRVFERRESVDFVRRRAPSLAAADAELIAEALGDLPLALSQSVGALEESGLPVAEFVELLRHGADMDMGLGAEVPLSYRSTMDIVLVRLGERNPDAVELLRLFAFLAPGSIPVGLLRDLPRDGVPERLAQLTADSARWSGALSLLAQSSVIQTDRGSGDGEYGDGPGEVIHMHRLVGWAVREPLAEQDAEVYARTVRRALAAADPGRPTDPRLWPRYAEIVPHLEASGASDSTDPRVAAMVLNCLNYLYRSGEYRTGLRIAAATAARWDRVLPQDDPRHSDLAHHRANLMRATGDYAATEELDRGVYERLRADRGPEDLLSVRAAGSLSADLRALGRYDEALELAEFARQAYTRLTGERDARTLGAQNNVAVSLRLLGRYAGALGVDRSTMDARRQVLRNRNNGTLGSENHFALDLRLLGRYDDATALQESNSAAHRTVLGADNPQTLRSEHNLALCYERGGDLTRASGVMSRLLERCRRVLGDTAPLTVRVAVTQATFDREQGDLDRARELGEFALYCYRAQFGDAHPYTAGVLGNHGLLLRALGDSTAAAVLERALSAMTAAVGADHPWTLACALNAAASRGLAGDGPGAAGLSRATAGTAAATLGKSHPLTLSCRIVLAADLRGSRDPRERQQADKIEEETLAALAATLGPQHPHTVSARARTRPHWDFEPFTT